MPVILPGNEYNHEEEGRVSVKNIKQNLSQLETNKNGTVQSKTSEDIIIEYYSYRMGLTGQEKLSEFLENINRVSD